MADEKKPDTREGRPVSSRIRGTNTVIGGGRTSRRVGKSGQASVGRYTTMTEDGKLADDVAYRSKLRNIQSNALNLNIGGSKTAALFGDGGLGMADIADSQNIGYNSFEFPVDALEMPQSRPEEIRYYRIAYDRDPIVGRAIDMHTELPLSKMVLEKPKCSSEEFADFIFDFFQGLVTNTKMMQVFIQAVREYWTFGEAFIFVEDLNDVDPCPEAKKTLNKGKNPQGSEIGKESENAPLGGTADRILDFMQPEKRASWARKRSTVLEELKQAGISFDFYEDAKATAVEIVKKKASIAKTAKILSRNNAEDSYPISITAAPGDAAPAGAAPEAGAGVPPDAAAMGADPAAGAEGAPLGEEGLGDVAGMGGDLGGDAGGFAPPMGGGGGGGMGLSTPAGSSGDVKDAIAMGSSISAQRELMEMKHYLKLLEKKKQLLEELKEIRENKREELELFSHIANADYEGFDRIKVLPPEQIEMSLEGNMTDGATIYYKPPAKQKEVYLQDPDVPSEVKDKIQQEGKIPLNQDPFEGSYVIHFARKKSEYELHGRSLLQRCMPTIIYRSKLRQVQSTIASRNMTPKSLIVAPDVAPSELMNLRAHIDEAKADPDYSVVVNYECRWDEIGSEGRLLSLDAEWNHTNSDLAIGLALSPELLIGEGMYSGNRIQLEIMNVSYLQFRDVMTGIIEDQIFKPIAMKKGFYEMDKYGRPRWIYPKVSFSRMALRDSGDLYDMLFNLYAKGSLPVDIIYEFLNLDPEDCKRKIEDSLFTVTDSKFNEMLSNIYGSVGDWLMTNTDLGKRLTKGLTLNEVENDDDEGPEGSGEGM
jgi:hypothetical protein